VSGGPRLELISDPEVRVGTAGTWRLRLTLEAGLSADEAAVVTIHGARDMVAPDVDRSLVTTGALEAGGLPLQLEWRGKVRSLDPIYDGRTGRHAVITASDDIPPGASCVLTVGDADNPAFAAQWYAQTLYTEVLVVREDEIVSSTAGPELRFVPDEAARAEVLLPSIGCMEEGRVRLVDRYGNVVDVRRVGGDVERRRVGDRVVQRLSIETDGMRAVSNPQLVEEPPRLSLFWGDPHIHTCLSDGAQRPDEAYAWARGCGLLDFAALADHDACWGPLEGPSWEDTQRAANDAYVPGSFVTLIGYEWSTRQEGWTEGHRNVYYPGDAGPMIHSHVPPGNTVAGLVTALRGAGALVVPHHPSAPQPTHSTDWSHLAPDTQRLVEICSKWGVSERRGGERPLTNPIGTTVQEGLEAGHRVGFVGGGDTHSSMGGGYMTETPRHNLLYPECGMTAVWAEELTRQAIFAALRARRCYATTGPRILVTFTVNGAAMGSEIVAASAERPRVVKALVAGTAPITRVDVVRNNDDAHTLRPQSTECALEWTDDSPLPPGGSFYYLRVVQSDGHMAFASPVWVDPPS